MTSQPSGVRGWLRAVDIWHSPFVARTPVQVWEMGGHASGQVRFQMAGVRAATAPVEIDVDAATHLRTALLQAAPSLLGLPEALMADTRPCEQCGSVFAPLREHARFCSVGCRAAWNREHLGDPAVEASALQWSVTAMSEATGRLPGMRAQDQPRALAAVGEAVWWITLVDATLVRHHREAYDAVLAARGPAEQRLTDATLAGLRFVRNRIGRDTGLDELVGSEFQATGYGRVTGWAWKPVPEPALDSLPPRGQTWEMARYHAYQTHLAGHTIGETLGRAATFLTITGANAACAAESRTGARR